MTDVHGVIHREVYRRQGEFAGWPANHGLWSWDNEIVAVFVNGKLGNDTENLHLEDRGHPFSPVHARSLDGGFTWETEPFSGRVPGTPSLSADEHLDPNLKAGNEIDPSVDFETLKTPIDFADPEVIILAARTGISGQPKSWFYTSVDRGRSWNGPFAFIGLENMSGLSARTDIVTLRRHEALFLLTATKADGTEGRVICARTTDGGLSFDKAGVVWDEPEGHAIMPASVLLPDGSIYSVVRRGIQNRNFLAANRSTNAGQSWHHAGIPVANTGYMGNPPALTLLPNGRMVLVYGFRDFPFGIRFVVSENYGRSWSAPYTLRNDGGEPDLGYPRVVVRPDGKMVAIYYFNEANRPERYICASIFDVDN